jgi:hypothetical protein
VKPHNPLKELVAQDLLISPSQVISLSREKMVVDDLLSGEKDPAEANAAAPSV